ncbi:MAG: glycosyltransferase family 2 protein [Alphaproteobacteria bacterium]
MGILSICIPTRNRADLLERHLRHIATFKSHKYEIIVSDNCSSDHTPETVETIRSVLPGLRYVRQQEPLLDHEVHSASCALATGDYIIAVSDDDVLQEAGLLRAIEMMDRDSGIVAVYGARFPYDGARGFEEAIAAGMARTPRTEGIFGRQDMVRIFKTEKHMTLPIFRRSVFLNSHLPIPHLLPFDFHGMARFMKFGNIAMIKDCTALMWPHDQQNSGIIYRDETINNTLSDVEMFVVDAPEDSTRDAVDTLGLRTVAHYLLCSDQASRDGKFLLSRQYFLRALGRMTDGQDIARSFQDSHMVSMMAEALSQFFQVTGATSVLICEDRADCRAVADKFAERHPDVTIRLMNGEDIVDRPPRDEELYFVGDATIPRRCRQRFGAAGTRIRALDNFHNACRLVDDPT